LSAGSSRRSCAVSGTCFTQTTIFMAGDRPPTPGVNGAKGRYEACQ
jgi:hypothetical protein